MPKTFQKKVKKNANREKHHVVGIRICIFVQLSSRANSQVRRRVDVRSRAHGICPITKCSTDVKEFPACGRSPWIGFHAILGHCDGVQTSNGEVIDPLGRKSNSERK
jgi:hypothetical protein